ncbi:hypothetical protein PIB30_034892 [Stylosanthes scabra]|uniref:GLTSCR protein conserved domain-containing protein n=1 Tax=Stylosanthes scabra TaxID=79078 RepID=A0ABU6SD62_9FABA|nr:hypothetical protein [Stylosanthes scabra]
MYRINRPNNRKRNLKRSNNSSSNRKRFDPGTRWSYRWHTKMHGGSVTLTSSDHSLLLKMPAREFPEFSSCRLLPYHVVADYEAEEDDRILDSDTTGQMLSRSQQWDNNIAAKIAEFTATFEKQALAFNIITQKRGLGEFRSEERLMIEQALLQEEKRAMMELRAELESREKAGREAHEAKLRMAMVQAEQARADSQSHAEMMSRTPIRGSALGSQGSDMAIGHDMGEQDQGGNPGEMMNGWGNNAQREEKEPSDDFLNDEAENGDTGTQDGWRDVGEFDLNAR